MSVIRLLRSTGFRALVEREVYRFMCVFKQTILPPMISSFLFISIFGFFLGSNLREVQNVSYIEFLIPGLVMMYLIESSYVNTSSSLFIARWAGHIQEILVAPLSYTEMVLAMILGGVARGLVTAAGVYAVSLVFARTPILHPWAVVYFSLFVSLSFASVGMVVGLLANEWEHLSIWTTFVITPLIYLGGVFHSTQMIPPIFRGLTYCNPLFYMINGMRYGMLGFSDANVRTSALIVFFFFLILFTVTVYMFRIGYKLRK